MSQTPQVLVIDPESQHQNSIIAVIKDIAPDAECFTYQDVQSFFFAYKEAVNRKALKNQGSPAGDSAHADDLNPVLNIDQVTLIIADFEATKEIDQNLWRKFLYALNQKHTPEQTPARLIYTSFDLHAEFDLTRFQLDVVFNLLIKPIDPIIASPSLQLALKPPGPMQLEGIYQQDQPAIVELIKEIDITRLTELGFRTLSRRPIPVHKIARYYGGALDLEGFDALFAYCYGNYQVQAEPPLYSSSFGYFGISKDHLGWIRRSLSKNKKSALVPFLDETKTAPSKTPAFLILGGDQNFEAEIKSLVNEKLHSAQVLNLRSFGELLEYLPPSSRKNISADIDSSAQVPAFGPTTMIRMQISESFDRVLGVESRDGTKAITDLVGTKLEAVLAAERWFREVLDIESYKRLRSLCRAGELKNREFFEFKIGAGKSFVELEKVSTSATETLDNIYLLDFRLLSDEEAFQHLSQNRPTLPQLDGIWIHENLYKPYLHRLVTGVMTQLPGQKVDQLKIMLFSHNSVTSYERAEELSLYSDVFGLPVDHFYLSRKIKMHYPWIQMKDSAANARLGLDLDQRIKTAQRVEVSTVSETHVTLLYHRPMRVGEVRRIILWIPNVVQMPEVLAICRHSEKQDELYRCDLLFFGVRDHELRHIRQWIRLNYVDTKTAGDGG